ncbi:hypothetical protein B0J11DRAFT_598948 [Dendryphion nanum]|uniref:Uncharacterized protein n=1 Tax=Dendryphion nanum TaxID=256645 RepID=A0A9P9D238_9PLEO|nr:hypothetical protein B0J11DRAFT_598948 [Dendryphion nanum]
MAAGGTGAVKEEHEAQHAVGHATEARVLPRSLQMHPIGIHAAGMILRFCHDAKAKKPPTLLAGRRSSILTLNIPPISYSMADFSDIEDDFQVDLYPAAAPTRLPIRQPKCIVDFSKAQGLSTYLIRWQPSILTGNMLTAYIGDYSVLQATWKIRRHSSADKFAPPGEFERTGIYDVLWRDTRVPCTQVQDASLIHGFWTHWYEHHDG